MLNRVEYWVTESITVYSHSEYQKKKSALMKRGFSVVGSKNNEKYFFEYYKNSLGQTVEIVLK